MTTTAVNSSSFKGTSWTCTVHICPRYMESCTLSRGLPDMLWRVELQHSRDILIKALTVHVRVSSACCSYTSLCPCFAGFAPGVVCYLGPLYAAYIYKYDCRPVPMLNLVWGGMDLFFPPASQTALLLSLTIS